MSATILWAPADRGTVLGGVSTPSAFIRSMETAFGSSPWKLGPAEAERLLGMTAMVSERDNPYQELHNLITMHTRIEVWPVY